MPTPLEGTIKSFMNMTEKSKVSVVIPLFGYWEDENSKQLNADTLKLTLERVYSNIHHLYLIFVAEEKRLPMNVGNILAAKSKGGNAKGVSMKRGATYGEYLRSGIATALEDTKCQYIVCVNPFVMLQHNALDVLIDRCNKGDDARLISGFDVNGVISGDKFDGHIYNTPIDERNIDLNLFGMKRYIAEMLPMDTKYKTHHFIARDLWQSLFAKGFESIVSQKIPIFSFDVDWSDFESRDDFELDKAHFISKWHFNEDTIKYGK